jgi:hypothetical protein
MKLGDSTEGAKRSPRTALAAILALFKQCAADSLDRVPSPGAGSPPASSGDARSGGSRLTAVRASRRGLCRRSYQTGAAGVLLLSYRTYA